MYNQISCFSTEEKNLNYNIRITCPTHNDKPIINVCSSSECKNKCMYCYDCMRYEKQHYEKHSNLFIPLSEYLQKINANTVHAIITGSELIASQDLNIKRNVFNEFKNRIMNDRSNFENMFKELKESIISELDSYKSEAVKIYDGLITLVTKNFEEYTKMNEASGGTRFLEKFGDLQKTINKFDKLNSLKAIKLAEEIEIGQETLKHARKKLYDCSEEFNKLLEVYNPYMLMQSEEIKSLSNYVKATIQKQNLDFFEMKKIMIDYENLNILNKSKR